MVNIKKREYGKQAITATISSDDNNKRRPSKSYFKINCSTRFLKNLQVRCLTKLETCSSKLSYYLLTNIPNFARYIILDLLNIYHILIWLWISRIANQLFFFKLFETFIYKVKVFKFSLCTLGTIYLVRTQNFPKNYISHLFSCVYEGVGTWSSSGKNAYVLNGWSLGKKTVHWATWIFSVTKSATLNILCRIFNTPATLTKVLLKVIELFP